MQQMYPGGFTANMPFVPMHMGMAAGMEPAVAQAYLQQQYAQLPVSVGLPSKSEGQDAAQGGGNQRQGKSSKRYSTMTGKL
mmetsp:Transcript_25405/g.45294  ORF Transcript_25405/g.45294 Transcript_25405/m.45294 type:complete len:81 (+) Transcript_25405:3-245(+)